MTSSAARSNSGRRWIVKRPAPTGAAAAAAQRCPAEAEGTAAAAAAAAGWRPSRESLSGALAVT